MRLVQMFDYDRPLLTHVDRVIWVALIIGGGIGLSLRFACVTPFAALAALAGLNLSRRDAIAAISLGWLANQAIGYGYLNYPWTWDSAAWGVAIGLSAGCALFATRGLSTTRPAPFATSLPFVASFAAYELSLYIARFLLPGGEGAFSASVVWHVFVINATALLCLLAIYHLATLVGRFARLDALGSTTVGVTSLN